MDPNFLGFISSLTVAVIAHILNSVFDVWLSNRKKRRKKNKKKHYRSHR